METLYEQDDVEVVKISQRFDVHDNSLNMFVANFSDDRIELLHTDLRYSSENFRLAHNQMDGLFTAWEAYKAKQELKRLTEQKRIAEVEAEAYALADSYQVIRVERKNDYWYIFMPDTSWDDEAYTADELLNKIQQAVAYRQPIEEAYKLAAQYPAIRIKHEEGTQLWFVCIPEPNLFGLWAYQSDIVTTVQQAIETYEQHLIKTND